MGQGRRRTKQPWGVPMQASFQDPGGRRTHPPPPPTLRGSHDLKKKPVPHGGIENIGPMVEGREAWRGNVGKTLPL